MGLIASATCEMGLGEREPCVGYLVGGEHRGMRQMFQVIEHARMAVGFKSFSTLSSAYFQALRYAFPTFHFKQLGDDATLVVE